MGSSHGVVASLSLSLAFCLVSLRGKVGESGQTDPSTSAGPQAELRAGREHSKQFTLAFPGPQPSAPGTTAAEAGGIQCLS